MGLNKFTSNEEHEPSRFWKKTIQDWKKTKLSQSEFCRIHGLRPTSFSYWKNKIEQMAHTPPRRNQKQIASSGASREVSQAPFIRFSVPGAQHNRQSELWPAEEPARLGASVVAAELIDKDNGLTLRIFHGAEPATVDSLVARFLQH